jgi:ribosomal protein L37E
MIGVSPLLARCRCCGADGAHEPDSHTVRCAACGLTYSHTESGRARMAWGEESALPLSSELQTRFIDETDAAMAGHLWLEQFITPACKIEYADSAHGRRPRVKWIALFDVNDKLTHAALLTRDESNWTQLTRVSAGTAQPQLPRS